MSRDARDPRLEALLLDLPPAPPVPAALAARVLAAAAAMPQEAHPVRARRAAARRDRRGRWLRRPLLASTVALGLVVSSAVAATLAGVPIPQKIASVLFPEEKAGAPKQAAPQRRAARPAPATQRAPASVETADATAAKDLAALQTGPTPWRRLFMAERMIAARRAMGLPTPGADRLERQLRRRAERWQAATPEQRAAWTARQQLRQDVRRAMLSTPEGREELARLEQRQRWGARHGPGMLTPEQRAERQAMMQDWRARRQAGLPPTPEEHAARRAWRAERQAGRPPLTEEQRAFRQEQFRRWREARRDRWPTMDGRTDANPPAGTEGPPASGR